MIVVIAVLLLAGAVAIVLSRRPPAPARPPAKREADSNESAPDPIAGIEAFWSWWTSRGARLVADAIAERRPSSIAEELGARVHGIHPSLAWELGPGRQSQHHLALSSQGDAELRVIGERWKARAPAPDATWEYHAARQANPAPAKLSLEFSGVPLGFDDLRFSWEVDEDRERVHVKVHHPGFRKLPEKAQLSAMYVALDNILGEDDVERWLGGVECSPEALADGKGVGEFAAAVRALAASATGEKWAVLKGKNEHGACVATVNLALKKGDHLLMDQHHAIVVALDEPTEAGLSTKEESDELNALEDELIARLGHDAVWIGRETGNGERVIHFHAATHGPAPVRVEEWRAAHPERRIQASVRYDPAWEILQRF